MKEVMKYIFIYFFSLSLSLFIFILEKVLHLKINDSKQKLTLTTSEINNKTVFYLK